MNADSTSPQLLKRLSALVVTVGASQMILLSQISLISAFCGLSIASLGMMIALGTACIMVAGPVWGRIIDHYGSKPVLRIGLISNLLANTLFVGGVLLMGLGQLEHRTGIIVLSLSRFFHGMGAAGIVPACQSWGVSHSPEALRMKVLSSLSAAANIGRVIGPLLALPSLALLSWLQFENAAWQLMTLLWVLILPLFGLWALSGLNAPRLPTAPEKDADKRDNTSKSPLLLFALATLCTTSVAQVQVLLGPVLEDYYGLSALSASKGSAAMLVFIALLAAAIQLLFVRHITRPHLSLVSGGLMMVAGIGLMQWLLGDTSAVLGLALMIAGVTIMIPSYTNLISVEAGPRQGRIFGQLSMLHTAGFTLGFAVGGSLYTYVTSMPTIGLLACAAALLLVLLLNVGTRSALSQIDSPQHQQ